MAWFKCGECKETWWVSDGVRGSQPPALYEKHKEGCASAPVAEY